MAKLHYVSIMSGDGYIGDGHYDWSEPVEGSTAFITDIVRPLGTYLYGRRNFETMSYWEDVDASHMAEEHQEFKRVWKAADKIVYSKSLKSVITQKTQLESDFNFQKIRELKKHSAKDLGIGGPNLAAQAMKAQLVDEIHLFVVPTTIGKTIPAIPVFPPDMALNLKLLGEARFCESWLYLRYLIKK